MKARLVVIAGAISIASVAFGINLREIEALVDANVIYSADDLLQRLSESQRSRFVVMRKSRSLQEATDESPRVISYGDDAELLVAFNGDPASRGYHTVELLGFDTDRKEWEARTLELDLTGATPAKLSAPNLSRCQQCHGNPVRPLWEPYPFWPGAAGEKDSLSAEDEAWLEDFAYESGDRPRYKWMRWRENLEIVRKDILRFTHAFHLHGEIESIEATRLAAWMQAQPAYRPLRFAIAGALVDCENFLTWAPPAPGTGQAAWADLKADTIHMNNKAPELHRRLIGEVDTRIITNLRYLFETRSYSLRSWSHSIAQPYLFTTVASVTMKGILQELRDQDSTVGNVDWDYAAVLTHYDRLTYPTLYTESHRNEMIKYCKDLAHRQLTP